MNTRPYTALSATALIVLFVVCFIAHAVQQVKTAPRERRNREAQVVVIREAEQVNRDLTREIDTLKREIALYGPGSLPRQAPGMQGHLYASLCETGGIRQDGKDMCVNK